METKEYLSQVRRYDRMVENKIREIANLREIIFGTAPMSSNTDRVQTTKDPDKICSYVSKIVDMEREVNDSIDKRKKIVQQIESIPDMNMYDVLAQKYILGIEVKAIHLEGVYSLKQTKRILYSALNLFEKMYGKEYIQDKMSLNVPT